jgi:hypothetical protein
MIDGLPWSTGKFNVGPDGQLVDLDGNPVRDGDYDAGRDLTDSAMVLITIQPPDGAVGAPQLKATLTAGIPAALSDSFADASGRYVVSEGFVSFEDLSLLTLPAAWAYKAWATIDGALVSLLRFGEHGDAPPSSLETLSLPAGATPEALFVSIEPAPDDSPLPCSMRPHSAELGAAEGDFANTSAGFPTGTAVIK